MKIDITTILGLIVALAGLGIGYLLEGGDFNALIAPSPILIIFGGTFGVVLITMRMEDVKQLPKVVKQVFVVKQYDYLSLINDLCSWAKISRKDGIVALDNIKKEIEDPFVRRGNDYILDGNDNETIKDFLDKEIEAMMERHHRGSQPFEQGGGFAPTMGIIGCVLGLVVILGGLGAGADVGKLAHGIAVAFIATLMGIALANIALLPFAAKLKAKSSEEVLFKEIAAQGILAIQTGENPLVLRKRLLSYLPDYMKAGKEEE